MSGPALLARAAGAGLSLLLEGLDTLTEGNLRGFELLVQTLATEAEARAVIAA